MIYGNIRRVFINITKFESKMLKALSSNNQTRRISNLKRPFVYAFPNTSCGKSIIEVPSKTEFPSKIFHFPEKNDKLTLKQLA